MKKFTCILLSCIIILLCIACNTSQEEANTNDSNLEKGFWVSSESYLVDYTIREDKIQLRYSFCFQNLSEYDIRANAFIISLKKRDLKGWLKYEKTFVGELLNGEKDVLIPSGNKINVILVIEGEYLGGEVNEDVYIKHLTMCQRIELTE